MSCVHVIFLSAVGILKNCLKRNKFLFVKDHRQILLPFLREFEEINEVLQKIG